MPADTAQTQVMQALSARAKQRSRTQQTYGYEILPTRAFLAAESDTEISMQRALDTSSCSTNTPINRPSNYVANTICISYFIGGTTYYNIQNQGLCGAGNDHTIRHITVRIQN